MQAPEIEKLKQVLAADIDKLRAPKGYLNAGIPNYNHLFGRDACISALQLLTYDSSIAKQTLHVMARYQATKRGVRNEAYPGKLLHEHYPDGLSQKLISLVRDTDKLRKLYTLLLWKFPYYGTIDAGAWFIILLHRYFKKTADEKMLRAMWPVALKIINWLESNACDSATNLVMYHRTYPFGLRNQSWKDTLTAGLKTPLAVVEVQGYYFEAYNCLAELAETVYKDETRAAEFKRGAQRLQAACQNLFWNEQMNYVSLAVNAGGERDDSVASNAGHLLFGGIMDKDQTEHIVKRLMDRDMWTPFGVRTLSSEDKLFDAHSYQQGSVWPFDNWVIYQGLLKNGYRTESENIRQGFFAAYEKLGVVAELYIVEKDSEKVLRHPEACTVQAWSTGAMMDMITSDEPVL